MPSITNLITIRIRIAMGMLTAAVVASSLAATAIAGPSQPDVPDTIKAPSGTKLFLVAHAVGVQIYDCTATSAGHEWKLAAPRADLFGANGKKIGTHYAGPHWEAKDGSTVKATRAAGVKVDPTAIDWLLLSASKTTVGADGDRFTGTEAIQRINTVGGLAPGAGTCAAATAGERVEIPYEADYAFYKKAGA